MHGGGTRVNICLQISKPESSFIRAFAYKALCLSARDPIVLTSKHVYVISYFLLSSIFSRLA